MTLKLPFPAPAAGWARRPVPTLADVAVLGGVAIVFTALAVLSVGVTAPFGPGQLPKVTTDPANLPWYAGRSLLRMFAALGEEPARGAGAGAAPRRAAVGAGARLPVDHGHRVHRAVPRQPAGARVRLGVRDLHVHGLEHDLQRVPLVPDRAARPRRGRPDVPPLAAPPPAPGRAPRRHGRPGLERDDEHGRRVVLPRRVRGDHRQQRELHAARHGLLHRPRRSAPRTTRRSPGRS